MWKSNGKAIGKTVCILAAAVLLTAGVLAIRSAVLQQQKKELLEKRGTVKILVLGDSIWDKVRDDTGIAARLTADLDQKAEIYNCAISGSRAASAGGVRNDGTLQDSICLYAMAQYMTGERVNAIPRQYAASGILDSVDFSSIDYVLIAYGLNDYFGAIRIKNPDDFYDQRTYEGSLCRSVELIRGICPKAQVMILSPTYCQGYSYGKVVHESSSFSYGGGTCPDYIAAAKEVAVSYGLPFVDNTKAVTISIHNGPVYLEDATHLSAKGRSRYAAHLAESILATYPK